MPWSPLRMARRPAQRRAPPVDRVEPQPVTTSDQVLLCCFGLDQAVERSSAQLRKALIEAGFGLREAREVVRASSLIERTSTRTYRVRSMEAAPGHG